MNKISTFVYIRNELIMNYKCKPQGRKLNWVSQPTPSTLVLYIIIVIGYLLEILSISVWRTMDRLTRTWQRTCCDPRLRCGLGASPCLEQLPPSAMYPNWSWPSPGQLNICFVVAKDDTKNRKYQRLVVVMRFVYYCHLLITWHVGLNTFLLLRCCCGAGMATTL